MTNKFLFVLFLFSVFSANTSAASLIVRGQDSLGNQLIYDDDLNITWYDYTKSKHAWANQISWANGLTVNFNNTIVDDWRLPNVGNPPGGAHGAEFHITNSEFGHLFYEELGNIPFNTPGWVPAANSGPFKNIVRSGHYWFQQNDDSYGIPGSTAFQFDFRTGAQDREQHLAWHYAIAVRSGDMIFQEPVPEPTTMLLFGLGLVGLASSRLRNQMKH